MYRAWTVTGALVLLALGDAGVFGQAAQEPAALKKVAAIEGITEYQLGNGLQVLLFPDRSKPTVTVNVTVFVGSRHEGYGETGMAHLLEHRLFKGTPKHPSIDKPLVQRGARFNGTTSTDRTNYFETLPAADDNLEFALRLEADRLVNSHVKREDLVSEMTVVRNEFERAENSPFQVLYQRIQATAYHWHNYAKSTLGNRTDIERVPIERLQAFYKKYYQPDNALLVVAGDFDEQKALGYIQKYFGAIPRPQRKLLATYTEEPPQDGERVVTLRRVGDVGLVGVGYHIPPGSHAEYPAVQVLQQVLTARPSGRLYKSLVETKLAAGVGGFAQGLHDPGMLLLFAEVLRGSPLEKTRDALVAGVEDIGAQGVTEDEVRRARDQLLKQRELAAANSGLLAIQLSNWAGQGDWRLYFLHRDRVEQVTPAEVRAAAAKYLRRNNRTVGLYYPAEKAERIPTPQAPDVKALVRDYKGREAVARGEAFDVSPANVEARTRRSALPGGVKLALLPKKTYGESVTLQLRLRYGDANSLKGLTQAAEFLPPLMARGTKKLTYQQLQDELTKQKASLTAAGGVGGAVFSIQAKRATLPAVLELLRQVLREPSLPEAEFDVLRRERLAAAEPQRNDPQALASRLLTRTLSPYPKDDVRYLPTVEEEIEGLKAVTREQVRRLYDEHLGGQAGEVTVVGDFEPQAVTELLAAALKDWKAVRPYARIARPATAAAGGKLPAVRTPDKANAFYAAGLVLPLDDADPDYPALLLGNYVLGGSTTSRLWMRVREKEGLSYGVGSQFQASAQDKRAVWGMNAIYNPGVRDKVEKAFAEEIARLLKEGVTAEELAAAQKGYLQGRKVNRASDALLASLLNESLRLGRTMAHQEDLEKRIAALTPEQVGAALRRHFDPKRLVIVTAGDFEKKATGGEK
jgi:zinc protease